jgi:polyisoprenoid-binding protein YceI
MSTAQPAVETTQLPVGVWTTDRIHSSLDFSVKHMVVGTFRSSLPDFEGTLTLGEDGAAVLEGVGRVASVVTPDPNLTGHLQSPDFFNAERYPEVSFHSTEIVRRGDEIRIAGELTLKGHAGRVELTGIFFGPVVGLGDAERIGMDLTGTFDRTEYGLAWNAPLPQGGFAVGDEVTIDAHLELVRGGDLPRGDQRQPPAGLPQHGAPARGGGGAARGGRASPLVATPEYNHSPPGQLKNAIDWASRPAGASVLRFLPAAVIGASTGAFGAVWSQAEMRSASGGPRPSAESYGAAGPAGPGTTGSPRLMRAPPPGAAAAVTVPPWVSAAWRTIARPSPEPGVRRAEVAR